MAGFNLSVASFSGNSFNFSAQDGSGSAFVLRSDGTSLYVAGFNTDTLYQYDLSAAFDLTTAAYSGKSFSFASEVVAARSTTIASDGSRIYVGGVAAGGGNKIAQYELSTPFDLATASHSGKTLGPSNAQVFGMAFNPLGGVLWAEFSTADSADEFSLSTAFDVSTAVATGDSFSLLNADTFPTGYRFSSDGTKFFTTSVLNAFGRAFILEYDVATPYDLGTATFTGQTFEVTAQDTFVQSLDFGASESKLFVLGVDNGPIIYEYTTPTPPFWTQKKNAFERLE